jgi:hypothetical protein
MKTLLRLTFLAMVAMAAAQPVEACSCAQRPVCAAFWDADVVFVGRADVTPLGPGAQRARFRVEEAFRGTRASDVVEIVGRGFGGSCAYAFNHGVRYLVFARRAPNGTLSSFFCDPNAPVDERAAELAFARDVVRNPSRGGRIVGAAILVPTKRDAPDVRLPGVTITIRSDNHVASAKTDALGAFSFDDVPKGIYTVILTPTAGIQPLPLKVVEIKGPGSCAFPGVTVIAQRLSR